MVALLVCGLMALLDGADAQSLAMAAPLLAKALAMSSGSVGLMFSCAAFGSALGYLGGGLMADRWGAKTVVTFSAVVIGAFQLITNLVGDPATLMVVRFVVSLGLGGAVPGLITLVSQSAPPGLQHRLQGFLWACFPVGVLTGGLVNGWILDHGRWQNIFVVGGILPLIIALALWGTVPRAEHRETPYRPDAVPIVDRAPGAFWPRALLTASVFFFTNGAIAVVLNWTPSLLVRTGYPPSIGAHALAWNAAGALISMTAAGFIVERSKIAPIVVGLAVSAVATILFSFLIHSLLFVTLLMVILGASLALAGTAAVFVASGLLEGNRQASGIGICMAVGRVGQMVFPGLVGVSLQAGGSPSDALLLSAALPAIGGAAAVALSLTSRNAR